MARACRDLEEVRRYCGARLRGWRRETFPWDALGARVVYGAASAMVPAKGRAWLHGALEGVGLLHGGDAPAAGYNYVLFLEEVRWSIRFWAGWCTVYVRL